MPDTTTIYITKGAETPPFRSGDVVLHRPSGETWVVAYADPETGYMSYCGWPDGEVPISDCTLTKAASDAEHHDWLDRIMAADGRRAVRAKRLYGLPDLTKVREG